MITNSQLLTNGAKVRLWSFAHGMNVRITESGTVDGNGRHGTYGKCVCMCMCVCVYVCVYVRVCTCMCACACVYEFVCLYVRACVCICVFVGMYVCVCLPLSNNNHMIHTTALYTVHSRGQGIVALQNVQKPNHWIAIKNGQTVGTVSDVIMMSL